MNKSEPQPQGKADLQSEGKATSSSDLTPQIAKRAYKIYEERGRENDPAVKDWEQANGNSEKNNPKANLNLKLKKP